MGVYKTKEVTKDGRCWFYRVSYTDVFGIYQRTTSKKYATRKEAEQAEREFLIKIDKGFKPCNMTFQDLYDKFLEQRETIVKATTKYNYSTRYAHIKDFMSVKCTDYNINMFEEWKKKLNNNPRLSTRYKNDIFKYWKSILNFGMDWFGLDFSATYRKMKNFTNPNEPKKEMEFYTFDEFQKFISFEDDQLWKTFFEALYYCGFRRGEARGLTWDNVDFKNKTITVSKQVISLGHDNSNQYYISSPKTNSSYRKLPLCDILLEDLKKLKEEQQKIENFKENYFVFGRNGGVEPFTPTSALNRRRRNADLSGLKHIRLHDFRHSCASLLINNGANITLVAKYLGHSKIEETLNTYSHMYQSHLEGIMNLINELPTNK